MKFLYPKPSRGAELLAKPCIQPGWASPRLLRGFCDVLAVSCDLNYLEVVRVALYIHVFWKAPHEGLKLEGLRPSQTKPHHPLSRSKDSCLMAELHLVVRVKDLRLLVQKSPQQCIRMAHRGFLLCDCECAGLWQPHCSTGAVCESTGLRWQHREKRGLAELSNLTAYWKTWSQLVNCVKKHETLRSLLGKEKRATCQALKPSCPCCLICSSRDLGSRRPSHLERKFSSTEQRSLPLNVKARG